MDQGEEGTGHWNLRLSLSKQLNNNSHNLSSTATAATSTAASTAAAAFSTSIHPLQQSPPSPPSPDKDVSLRPLQIPASNLLYPMLGLLFILVVEEEANKRL